MHDQCLGCAFILPKFLNRCSGMGFTSGNGAPTQGAYTLRLLTYISPRAAQMPLGPAYFPVLLT